MPLAQWKPHRFPLPSSLIFGYTMRRAVVVVEARLSGLFLTETTTMIFLGILLSIAAIGFFCWLLFTLAVFALPFFAGVSAGIWAYHTGAGWLGASTTVRDASMVVSDLRVEPELLEWSEPFAVEFQLEVIKPGTSDYVEFSIREPLDPESRAGLEEREGVMGWTEHVQRVDVAPEVFRSPGTKRIRGMVAGAPLLNIHDVAIAAIDAIDGSTVSETTRTMFFGATGESFGRLAVEWAVLASPEPG